MDGVTDATMRAFMGRLGAFSYAVSEFVRVSVDPLPAKVFRREVPELLNGGRTSTGMPVQVQILGGDPGRMALSARAAWTAGATSIDLNFGCPAPTVNRNDGGASLLRTPCRIREVVRAVRDALPPEVPVSAKLRLGWDTIEAIDETSEMAAEGGAAWLTIHARTRVQGYQPPVYWPAIGRVRAALDLPVVANGDIWTVDDLRRCQDETGCHHFMIGRGALADPSLPLRLARELGLPHQQTACVHADGLVEAGLALREDLTIPLCGTDRELLAGQALPLQKGETDWPGLLREFALFSGEGGRTLARLKQWLAMANRHGAYHAFDRVKRATSVEELFAGLPASQ